MEKFMDLVIMAGGMGSRFGGLKQIEPIDENDNFIIDYSIFDAIKCGFDRVIFIIKEEFYDIFRKTIGERIEKFVQTEYVFQSNEFVPPQVNIPPERVKPLGTAHAILCCKDVVKGNFAIINADDFYGYDAYKTIAEFLKSNKNPDVCALVGYKLKNTMTQNGAVKRGVCKTQGRCLTDIVECSVQANQNGQICATPLDGSDSFVVENATASMNMFGFSTKIFEYLQTGFEEFLLENQDNLLTCEYLIPEVVANLVKDKQISVQVLDTSAVWKGITYKADKEQFVIDLKKMKDSGEYPQNLWDEKEKEHC